MRFLFPGLVVPKARPRFDSTHKRAYHGARYAAWLEAAQYEVAGQRVGLNLGSPVAEPLQLDAAFGSNGVAVELSAVYPGDRPKGVRGDLDNLIGSVMDALAGGGAMSNDSQIVVIRANITTEEVGI